MSLKDLINVAGGLTPNADLTNVSLLIESTTVDSLGVATVESAPVYNINEDYKLSKNAVVKILPKVDFIRVDGNVYNPGLIVFEEKMTMKDAIDLAGGYMPYSLKNRIFIKKANGQIQKPSILRGAGLSLIHI